MVQATTACLSLGLAVVAFGILCFGADKPNIIVENNLISENGLGIYLGWNGDWFIDIAGNKIEDNGEGIRVVNRKALIRDNLIAENVIGVRIASSHEGESVTHIEKVILKGNDFIANEVYALQNLSDTVVYAIANRWGAADPNSANDRRYTLGMLLFPVSFSAGVTLDVTFAFPAGLSFPLLAHTDSYCEGMLCAPSVDGGLLLQGFWSWKPVIFLREVVFRGNLIFGPIKREDSHVP